MTRLDQQELTVGQIAELCGGRLSGNGDHKNLMVRGVGAIEIAPGDAVSWLVEEKLAPALANCKAAAVIGNEATVGTFARGIICDDPQWAVAKVLQHFHVPLETPEPGIHAQASVDPSAKIGQGAAVGAGAIIKRGAVIGAGCVIHPGVSVGAEATLGADCVLYDRCVIYDRCEIGDRVIIHSGTVIGADGFGYIYRDHQHLRLKHLGTVIIEDDVEIGANTCVDRGKVGPTRIGHGTKIDNLVQIAHNVQIGPHSIIVAMVGISGSVKIGAGVIFAGKAGASDGVSVGDGAIVAANSVATHDIAENARVWGIPARDMAEAMREAARVRKLPKLFARVAQLEKRLAELEKTPTPEPRR